MFRLYDMSIFLTSIRGRTHPRRTEGGRQPAANSPAAAPAAEVADPEGRLRRGRRQDIARCRRRACPATDLAGSGRHSRLGEQSTKRRRGSLEPSDDDGDDDTAQLETGDL